MLFLPIGHDRLVTRRLPLVTLGLIIINVFAFLLTETIGSQQSINRTLALKAIVRFQVEHPDVACSREVLERLSQVPEIEINELYWQIIKEKRSGIGAMSGQPINLPNVLEDTSALEWECSRLSDSFVNAFDSYWGYQYGFIPALHQSSAINYFTTLFLHTGLLHLAGNMLFLFLAGVAMEDTWGRGFYLLFYLVAGTFATATHSFTAPDSKIILIGASGAIAGVMGAFMVRYFRARIKFFYFIFIKAGTVTAPAYCILPLWIALELKDTFALAKADETGVAFWSHVGGFLFGSVLGVVIHHSGLGNRMAPKGKKSGASISTRNAVAEAVSHLEMNEIDDATWKLEQRLEVRPNDLQARTLLVYIYAEAGHYHQEIKQRLILIRLLIRQGNLAEAWNCYRDRSHQSLHPEVELRLPISDWMQIAHYLKEQGLSKDAAREFQNIGNSYPIDSRGTEALLNAAELWLALGEYEIAERQCNQIKSDFSLEDQQLMRIAEIEALLMIYEPSNQIAEANKENGCNEYHLDSNPK